MQELWVLRSARRLRLIDIYMKCREDSLNGFQVIERTRFCDRQRKFQGKWLKNVYMQELWFLRSARRLMLIDIYMKFRDNSLNGFQVTERTRLRDRQTDKVPRKVTQKI